MSKYACFLTHDWGTDELGRDNHARVACVAAALEGAGLTVWFDEHQLTGDVNAQMAEGIEESATVVVFVTQRYVTKVIGRGPSGANDNCKYEFDYALLRKGVERMIPMVMEPRCRNTSEWKGAVGGKLGPKLYIDLSEDGPAFEAGIDRLVEEIVKLAGADLPLDAARGGRSNSPHPQPRRYNSALDRESKPLASLDEAEVCGLLEALKLPALAQTCRTYMITGGDLACASDADLAHLGMTLPMQRRRLISQLESFARSGVRLELLRSGGDALVRGDSEVRKTDSMLRNDSMLRSDSSLDGPERAQTPPPAGSLGALELRDDVASALPRRRSAFETDARLLSASLSWAELVQAMRALASAGAEPGAAERCVRAVVARASDEASGAGARVEAAEAGALPVLVALLLAHAEHAGVQEASCLALIHLCAGSDAAGVARKQAAVDAGAFAALVDALRRHGRAPSVALAATWALGNLALGTDNSGLARKQAAFETGAVPALVQVCVTHCARADNAEQSLKSLANLLAGSDEGSAGRQQAALDAGALEAALSAMRAHESHAGVARSVLMLLTNVLSGQSAVTSQAVLGRKLALSAAGVVPLVVGALRAHAAVVTVQAWGAQLLAVLALGLDAGAHERKLRAIEAGALGPLVAMLGAHVDEPGVLEQGLRALCALVAGTDAQGSGGACARARLAIEAGAQQAAERVSAQAVPHSASSVRALELRALLAHLAAAPTSSSWAAPASVAEPGLAGGAESAALQAAVAPLARSPHPEAASAAAEPADDVLNVVQSSRRSRRAGALQNA